MVGAPSTTYWDSIMHSGGEKWEEKKKILFWTNFLNELLHEWFTKSILPRIVEDIAKVGAQTKEQVFMHAH